MTSKQFKTLKVGDSIYLRNGKSYTYKYTATVVLEIDRAFGKVRVLLRSKLLSYKYFPLKVDWSQVGACVGTSTVTYEKI